MSFEESVKEWARVDWLKAMGEAWLKKNTPTEPKTLDEFKTEVIRIARDIKKWHREFFERSYDPNSTAVKHYLPHYERLIEANITGINTDHVVQEWWNKPSPVNK